MASCLQVEGLSKRFGDRELFSDISFGISDSQRVAIVAQNGAGKTTLLSIISGEEDYQSGSIAFRKDLRVGYLRQTPNFNPDDSVMDACFSTSSEMTSVIRQYENMTEKIANGISVDD